MDLNILDNNNVTEDWLRSKGAVQLGKTTTGRIVYQLGKYWYEQEPMFNVPGQLPDRYHKVSIRRKQVLAGAMV